jgi:hypothetical protein
LKIWIRKIPRENLTVTKATRICINHFEERFIVRNFEFIGSDGKQHFDSRDVPVLTDDAYPTVFDGLPSYLSNPLPPKRVDPARRRLKVEEKNTRDWENWLEDDVILDYTTFTEQLLTRLGDYTTLNGGPWIFHKGISALFLFIFNETSQIPGLSVCVKVSVDMHVSVTLKNCEVLSEKLSWILSDDLILRRWSQMENLVSHYKCSALTEQETLTVNDIDGKLNDVCKILDLVIELASNDSTDDINIDFRPISFCMEQLRLACVSAKRRRYSSDLLRFAFLLFTRSSACYKILLSCGSILLPHISTLRRISTVLNVSAGNNSNDQFNYLTLCASRLSERERYVCLQLDEIHVNPSYSYKSGTLSGAALNSSASQAHSVQAFMVSSIFGTAKEIVSLNPVKNITGDDLTEMLRKIIDIVQNCGYTIVALISDNNQVNCKAFETLSGTGKLEPFIDNPNFPGQKIFFLFDTVHIIKCVRNIWLNQNDADQTFTYPQIPRVLHNTAILLNSRKEVSISVGECQPSSFTNNNNATSSDVAIVSTVNSSECSISVTSNLNNQNSLSYVQNPVLPSCQSASAQFYMPNNLASAYLVYIVYQAHH